AHRLEAQHRGQTEIAGGEDCDDPVNLHRGRGVDGAEAGVRERRAYERGVQRAGVVEIGDVFRCAGQHRQQLELWNHGADVSVLVDTGVQARRTLRRWTSVSCASSLPTRTSTNPTIFGTRDFPPIFAIERRDGSSKTLTVH